MRPAELIDGFQVFSITSVMVLSIIDFTRQLSLNTTLLNVDCPIEINYEFQFILN